MGPRCGRGDELSRCRFDLQQIYRLISCGTTNGAVKKRLSWSGLGGIPSIDMKCPHCSTSFHDNWFQQRFTRHGGVLADKEGMWWFRNASCPACGGAVIEVAGWSAIGNHAPSDSAWRMVHPVGAHRGPVSSHVPPAIAVDYIEACNVLPISPKASAALSRRCLQAILHVHGYKSKSLAQEVDALLNESDPRKSLPAQLHMTVDSIRNFGNFSAHPIDDKTSLQIIDVEPHEAEWCLEILEGLFEHFYVGPATARARKAALDAKLQAAGKPVSK
ncbi:DUF4145 domain-containing protein [Labrys sp. WJW]|uniref:DUF4145 domain-containing protein n=1 Tax=Labrys sp. WJW TaxID=1737983 RepID=UPI00352734A0